MTDDPKTKVTTADDVNAILALVRERSPNSPHGQLGILAVALVVICRCCDLPMHTALKRMREAFKMKLDLLEKARGFLGGMH